MGRVIWGSKKGQVHLGEEMMLNWARTNKKRGEEVSIPDRGNSPVMQEMIRSLCI